MADLKISQLTSATTPLAGTEVVPLVQSSTTKKVTVANLTAGRDVTTKSLTAAADTGVNPASPLTVQIRTTTNDTGWSTTNPWGRFSFYSEDTSDGGAKTLAAIDAVAAATSGGLAKVIFKAYDGASLADVFQIDFDKNIKISTAAKGINFTANTPAAGMTSQLLNWYEEGTFSPTIEGTTTVGTATYATQLGRYTRIGRQVFISIALDWSAGTGAGVLRIGGLPFTSSSTALTPGLSIGIIDSVALTAGTYPTAFVRTSSTQISFRESPTGGGSSTDVSYDAAGFVSLSGFYLV